MRITSTSWSENIKGYVITLVFETTCTASGFVDNVNGAVIDSSFSRQFTREDNTLSRKQCNKRDNENAQEQESQKIGTGTMGRTWGLRFMGPMRYHCAIPVCLECSGDMTGITQKYNGDHCAITVCLECSGDMTGITQKYNGDHCAITVCLEPPSY